MSAILLEFIKAAVHLLALAVMQSLVMRVWPRTTAGGQLVSGLLFGTIAIVGMATPIELSPGVIFDARSVTLGVAGFWVVPSWAVSRFFWPVVFVCGSADPECGSALGGSSARP